MNTPRRPGDAEPDVRTPRRLRDSESDPHTPPRLGDSESALHTSPRLGDSEAGFHKPPRLGGSELERINRTTESIIGCAIAVHRELRSGLFESVYRSALMIEFD